MKKITKIIAVISALVLLSATVFTIISCSNKKEEKVDFNKAFNYSTIGGISALNAYASDMQVNSELNKNRAIAPLNAISSNISDEEKEQIINNLKIAQNMLNGEIVQSEVKQSDRENYSQYYYLSTKDVNGENQTYYFYYNSTNVINKEEPFERESEQRLEGIVLFNSIEYVVIGEMELENNEEEVTFIIKMDEFNFVEIELESENNQKEYSYTLYKNGKEVFETSVEYEISLSGRVELTFENQLNGEEFEYKYEFYKKDGKNFVRVKQEKEGLISKSELRATIQIIIDNNGNNTYVFVN